MQLAAGAERHTFYYRIAVFGVKPPAGGRAAPVAYILAVQLYAVVKAHFVANHTPRQPELVAQRQPGQAVFARCQQAVAQRVGLGLVETLLRFQQLANRVIHSQWWVRQGRPAALVQSCHKYVIFVEVHPLGVREHIHRTQLPGRGIANVHR